MYLKRVLSHKRVLVHPQWNQYLLCDGSVVLHIRPLSLCRSSKESGGFGGLRGGSWWSSPQISRKRGDTPRKPTTSRKATQMRLSVNVIMGLLLRPILDSFSSFYRFIPRVNSSAG